MLAVSFKQVLIFFSLVLRQVADLCPALFSVLVQGLVTPSGHVRIHSGRVLRLQETRGSSSGSSSLRGEARGEIAAASRGLGQAGGAAGAVERARGRNSNTLRF